MYALVGPTGVWVAARTDWAGMEQEKPVEAGWRVAASTQRLARKGRSRPRQVADGSVVPMKRGNARGGKGP